MPNTDEEREKSALQLAIKELDGKKLTANEKKELAWLRLRWLENTAKEVPKKTYLTFANRKHMQLDRQAEAFGLPLTGNTVNLFVVIQAFHDFVAEHAQKIKQFEEVTATKKAAEARMLEIKIKQAELDLQERMDKLIDRSLVREQLAWLAAQFAAMAEEVGRNHGPAPQASINGFLEIMSREVEGGRLEV